MGIYQQWMNSARSYIDQWARYLSSTWGISPIPATRLAALYLLFYLYGLRPVITSGYRSAAKQAELYARWLAGDKSIHSPAKPGTSPHEKKKAIDIATNNWATAAWIAHQLGVKTGYEFGDGVHFQYDY